MQVGLTDTIVTEVYCYIYSYLFAKFLNCVKACIFGELCFAVATCVIQPASSCVTLSNSIGFSTIISFEAKIHHRLCEWVKLTELQYIKEHRFRGEVGFKRVAMQNCATAHILKSDFSNDLIVLTVHQEHNTIPSHI